MRGAVFFFVVIGLSVRSLSVSCLGREVRAPEKCLTYISCCDKWVGKGNVTLWFGFRLGGSREFTQMRIANGNPVGRERAIDSNFDVLGFSTPEIVPTFLNVLYRSVPQ